MTQLLCQCCCFFKPKSAHCQPQVTRHVADICVCDVHRIYAMFRIYFHRCVVFFGERHQSVDARVKLKHELLACLLSHFQLRTL